METPVEREDVRELLRRWNVEVLREQQIHELAEQMDDVIAAEPRPERGDPYSIVVEVIAQLSILDWQLITQDDIPAFLSFLDTPSRHEHHAWVEWEAYWKSIDYKARQRALHDNPYYAKAPIRAQARDPESS